MASSPALRHQAFRSALKHQMSRSNRHCGRRKNFSLLMPDGAYLGLDGVIPNRLLLSGPGRPKVLVGALSSYEWLSETMVGDAAVRDRGKRLCRMIVGSDLLSLPLVFSFCRKTSNDLACLLPVILYRESNRSSSSELYLLCGEKWLQKKAVSSVRVSEASEKAIDKLNAKEFRERFLIPHDVLIDLVNEEAAMPTEKGGKTLSSSQRNNSTRGSGSLCQPCSKEFLHFSQIPPSSFIPTLSGC
ncbi:hypothetical protein CK203_039631 [Vitis vinifera]|uniref:Uncharacterized protein n=1 Tax=Vitis vinifera TaxID=29760 RepID=A0A438HFV3_VITVI|nr:hypothetical protein CK203_039631 [Vitis vinifera]